jgi:hypothetical protein
MTKTEIEQLHAKHSTDGRMTNEQIHDYLYSARINWEAGTIELVQPAD